MAAGASLYELSNVVEPIIDSRTDRAVGVRTKDGRRFTAPMVVAADGNSTRLSLAMGLNRREDRPMGVAVRTYYASPRHRDDWFWSRGWSYGRASRARAHCCRDTGGSLAWATAPAMSGSAS